MKLLNFIIRLIELILKYKKPVNPKQTYNYTTKNTYYLKLPYTAKAKGNKKTG